MRVCEACGFDRCDDLSSHCRQCGAKLPTVKARSETEVAKSLAPAWFHYLEIPQVGIVELSAGQAFVIGRGERCDLRLTQLGSERLAAIFWTEDYSEATIERVQSLLRKERLKVDPDCQLLEDAICLVFLEHYMLEFVAKHADYTEEKWIDIIQKTWNKMSPEAQAFALSGRVALPESLVPLIQKAVAS